MLYLLDANVLITANHTYYPLDRVPEFWDWLVDCANQGYVKLPVEMYEEIDKGDDDLRRWVRGNRAALLLDEEVDAGMVEEVTVSGYAPDLDDEEVERVGADPFLIAHAFRERQQRVVVTTEVSKARLRRANRRIPDVCRDLRVHCCTIFEFIKALDFTTGWRR